MKRLILRPWQISTMRRHAAGAYPEECCGILLGRRSAAGLGDTAVLIEEVVPATNACRRRRARRYEIAPQVLIAAHRRARRQGSEVVGYYHSHPDRSPRPGRRDREDAWPGVSYLIVEVRLGRAGRFHSWRLRSTGGFEEEVVELARRFATGARGEEPAEDPAA